MKSNTQFYYVSVRTFVIHFITVLVREASSLCLQCPFVEPAVCMNELGSSICIYVELGEGEINLFL